MDGPLVQFPFMYPNIRTNRGPLLKVKKRGLLQTYVNPFFIFFYQALVFYIQDYL